MPDIWWEVIARCLDPDRRARPTLKHVLDVMEVRGLRCATRTCVLDRRRRSPKDLKCPFQVTALFNCELLIAYPSAPI